MKTSAKNMVILFGGFVAVNAVLAGNPAGKPYNCNNDFFQTVMPADTQITGATLQHEPVEYCLVEGNITTDNPGPNWVHFQLSLPSVHNRRFYFQGLGGSAGALPAANPVLLERGYAVAVTDTGNQSGLPGGSEGLDWSFMIDEAKALDYDRRGGHVATVAAQELTRKYYGPRKMWRYHSGCSGGGRMGISAAIHYPDDYDGIVLGAPGRSMANIIHFGKVAQYVKDHIDFAADPAPVVNMVVAGATIEAQWDAADGAVDGQIWDPSVVDMSAQEFKDLLAASGPAISDDWQAVIDMIGPGYDLRDQGGVVNIGPYFYSSVTEWPLWTPLELAPGFFFFFPDQVFGTVTRGAFGPTYDYVLDWDFSIPDDELELLDTWSDLQFSQQVNGEEFAQFRNRGGKVILWHGVHDAAIAFSSSVEMYEGIIDDAKIRSKSKSVRDQQVKKTQKWARFFPVPGIGHCQNSVAGDGPDDTALVALESLAAWVEHGKEPTSLIARRNSDNRTFKLCPYPGRSKFIGGVDNPDGLDVNDADNWTCND